MIKKLSWTDLPEEQVNPQMKRRFIHGDSVMIARVEFADGFVVPWHSHPNEQVTEVLEGTMRFWFDHDETCYVDLHPGDAIVIAGHRPHKAQIIGKVVEMDVFAPPRQDWIEGSDAYLRG